MSKYIIAVFISWMVVGLVNAKQADNFQISYNGIDTDLHGLRGKVVYLDFWASWCKPCRKSFPWMNSMQKKYAGQGLQIITVNLDSEQSSVDEFLRLTPTDLPIIYDPTGKIADKYQLLGMPSSYLIDKSGKIQRAHKGFFTKKEAQYEQEIKMLLSE